MMNEKLEQMVNMLETQRVEFEKNPEQTISVDGIAERLIGRKSENKGVEKKKLRAKIPEKLLQKDISPALPYIVSGFSHVEPDGIWTNGGQAKLLFEIKNPEILDSVVLHLHYETFSKQNVSLYVNGLGVADWEFEGSETREISIPKKCVKDGGVFELCFELPDAISPKELGINADDRNLALKFIDLTIASVCSQREYSFSISFEQKKNFNEISLWPCRFAALDEDYEIKKTESELSKTECVLPKVEFKPLKSKHKILGGPWIFMQKIARKFLRNTLRDAFDSANAANAALLNEINSLRTTLDSILNDANKQFYLINKETALLNSEISNVHKELGLQNTLLCAFNKEVEANKAFSNEIALLKAQLAQFSK